MGAFKFMFTEILMAAFALIFAENIVFGLSLGSGTIVTMSGKEHYLAGFCLSCAYMTVIGTSLTFLISPLIENPDLYYFEPLFFTIIIGIIYVLTLICASRLFQSRFERLKKYIHVSAFNSVVLGSMVLAEKNTEMNFPLLKDGFLAYFLSGLFTAAAFTIAVFTAAAVFERLHSEKTPYAFRGYPAMLLYMGIIALAFYGF
jgi:electron transport complex protein RnfA